MTDGRGEVPLPRPATVDDAGDIARLLHDFNVEFDTPSPGPDVLRPRLEALLAGDRTSAIDAGSPIVAVALVTTRPNVWYDGAVALLDELYVVPDRRDGGIGSAIVELLIERSLADGVDAIEIDVDAPDVDAQRFYERHGWSGVDPDTGDRAYRYHRELRP